jgi:hypothetical protein
MRRAIDLSIYRFIDLLKSLLVVSSPVALDMMVCNRSIDR